MKVLIITSEWPTPEHLEWAPFIVEQVEQLRSAGIKIEVFSFRGAKRIINYYRARKQVQKKLSEEKFDLIHAQFGQSALLVIPSHLPLVITFHGSDVLGIVGQDGRYTFRGWILKQVSRLVAQLADAKIIVSAEMLKILPKGCYHLLPMGVNLELFRPMPCSEARAVLNLHPKKQYILFGASPSIVTKRYGLAKQAVGLLAYPDLCLLALEGIPHEQVPFYMNACDVLLLTSLHEGSPMVIKEALACNLPVVSTDVGDIRQRIGMVEGCVVCPDDHPETIAGALRQALSRGQRIDGRERVLDLDERLISQKVIQVYQSVLEKKKR